MFSRKSDPASGSGRPVAEGGRPPAARSAAVPPSVSATRIDHPVSGQPASGQASPGHAAGSAPPAADGTPSGSGAPFRGTPTAADYYAVNRGGGLFSEGVSQRIGARISVSAHKRHLSPTVLTIFNLGLGCLVSFVV